MLRSGDGWTPMYTFSPRYPEKQDVNGDRDETNTKNNATYDCFISKYNHNALLILENVVNDDRVAKRRKQRSLVKYDFFEAITFKDGFHSISGELHIYSFFFHIIKE